MTNYLLIAGSYHGGWCWSRVARLLREAGHEVHTPTLTGLGERAHLLRPDIGLETHITDIVQVMNYEDLHDVTIVSHSYGGVVAGGAVDRMPGRFARAVYFDALVPRDGASVIDLLPDEYGPYFTSRITADGRIPLADDSLRRWGLDSDEDLAWVRPRLTDQPAATFTDKLALSRPVESAGPAPIYIYATVKPTADLIQSAARHARSTAVWDYQEIDAPHDYMITHPLRTAEMLRRI